MSLTSAALRRAATVILSFALVVLASCGSSDGRSVVDQKSSAIETCGDNVCEGNEWQSCPWDCDIECNGSQLCAVSDCVPNFDNCRVETQIDYSHPLPFSELGLANRMTSWSLASRRYTTAS